MDSKSERAIKRINTEFSNDSSLILKNTIVDIENNNIVIYDFLFDLVNNKLITQENTNEHQNFLKYLNKLFDLHFEMDFSAEYSFFENNNNVYIIALNDCNEDAHSIKIYMINHDIVNIYSCDANYINIDENYVIFNLQNKVIIQDYITHDYFICNDEINCNGIINKNSYYTFEIYNSVLTVHSLTNKSIIKLNHYNLENYGKPLEFCIMNDKIYTRMTGSKCLLIFDTITRSIESEYYENFVRMEKYGNNIILHHEKQDSIISKQGREPALHIINEKNNVQKIKNYDLFFKFD